MKGSYDFYGNINACKNLKKLSERVDTSLMLCPREVCALSLLGMHEHLVVDEYDHCQYFCYEI